MAKRTRLDWFPFEVPGFEDATREWTDEEVGQFVRLLLRQWKSGDRQAVERARFRMILSEPLRKVVRTKFEEVDGWLTNEKMARVWAKQSKGYKVRKAQAEKLNADRRQPSGAVAGADERGQSPPVDKEITTDTKESRDEDPADGRSGDDLRRELLQLVGKVAKLDGMDPTLVIGKYSKKADGKSMKTIDALWRYREWFEQTRGKLIERCEREEAEKPLPVFTTDHRAEMLWASALAELKKSATKSGYETWWRPTIGFYIDGEEFVVIVPSQQFADWLPKLEEQVSIAEKVVGWPLRFVVGRREI